MSNIDLASFDTVKGSNEGFDVRIFHPGTNEDLPYVISVLGKDSDQFQKVSRSQSKRRMAKMQKGGFRNAGNIPVEEVEQNGTELLAACSTGWKTLAETDDKGEIVAPEKETLDLDGADFPFSVDNAEILYTRFPWIKEQVDTAIGDRANFIKA
ncbi:MAG: hypothetical protein JRC86_00435 [Deltaproteobacteria bacterium]|nr:hypothetical protein [Deltaproteobacteria bacterium]